METLLEKYKILHIDGSLISLEHGDMTTPYFCYPVNATVIGFEGCILYCLIPGYGDIVFASNPESCADINVYPLAENFSDFLRLILACGSANAIEQIVWMKKEQFHQKLQKEKKNQTAQQKEVLTLIGRELSLAPMTNPFEYVKALQTNFDGSKIKYSDEYYDTLGLERPDGTKAENGFAFEPVVFSVAKKKKE